MLSSQMNQPRSGVPGPLRRLRFPARIPVLLASLLGCSTLAGQQVPREDPAAKTARARQEAVKSFDIVYKKTEVLSPGAVSQSAPPFAKPKKPVPEREMTLESTNRLLMDGEKFRFEGNHPMWFMPDGILNKRSVLYLFDGSVPKMWFPDTLDRKGRPQGTIPKDPRMAHPRAFELAPIQLTLRGLEPAHWPYTIDELKPSGVKLVIGGVPCLEYIVSISEQSETRCWVDPGKKYVIRRVTRFSKGRLRGQIDARYRSHEVCGWVPDSWVCKEYSPGGTIRSTTSIAIQKLRINVSPPPEQFQIIFPPQTWVDDQRKGKHYRIQSDGSMRELSDPNGDEFSGSGVTVLQPGDSWYRHNQWLLFGIGTALVLVFLAYGWRRRTKAVRR